MRPLFWVGVTVAMVSAAVVHFYSQRNSNSTRTPQEACVCPSCNPGSGPLADWTEGTPTPASLFEPFVLAPDIETGPTPETAAILQQIEYDVRSSVNLTPRDDGVRDDIPRPEPDPLGLRRMPYAEEESSEIRAILAPVVFQEWLEQMSECVPAVLAPVTAWLP